MNKVHLIGRLTRDPEVRYTQGQDQTCVARYTLAVDRRYSHNENNSVTADFISCVAFGKVGEFAEKYLKKGMKIAVTGRIQTGSFTGRDGNKVYTTDVIIEEQEFVESKKDGADNTAVGSSASVPEQSVVAAHQESFMNIPDGIDSELPFN